MACCKEVTVRNVRKFLWLDRVHGRHGLMRDLRALLAMVVALFLPALAAAQGPASDALVSRLSACRTSGSDAERLRCYDLATADVLAAVKRKDIVLIDRAALAEARPREERPAPRQLGLPVNAKTGDREEQLTGIIRSVSSNRGSAWLIALEDGTVWQQTDGVSFAVEPRKGDAVLVKQAAMGTYKLKVGRQPAVRVRRVS